MHSDSAYRELPLYIKIRFPRKSVLSRCHLSEQVKIINFSYRKTCFDLPTSVRYWRRNRHRNRIVLCVEKCFKYFSVLLKKSVTRYLQKNLFSKTFLTLDATTFSLTIIRNSVTKVLKSVLKHFYFIATWAKQTRVFHHFRAEPLPISNRETCIAFLLSMLRCIDWRQEKVASHRMLCCFRLLGAFSI